MRPFGFACVVLILLSVSANAQTRYLSQPKGDAWLDLLTGRIHSATEDVKPSGPLIWGSFEGKSFRPSRSVEYASSAKQPDPKDQPGWIELQTGQIYSDVTARAPQSPYLRGRITAKGLFMVYPEELAKWSGSAEAAPPPRESPGRPMSDSSGAVLRSVEGEPIEVPMQPTEINIDRAVKWQQSEVGATLLYVASEPGVLQMEVNLRSDSDVYRDYVRNLERLTQEGDRQRPPLCIFSWGRNFPQFKGVIESLNVKYTAFAPDGTPLRATVNLRMKQADRLLNRREGANR